MFPTLLALIIWRYFFWKPDSIFQEEFDMDMNLSNFCNESAIAVIFILIILVT